MTEVTYLPRGSELKINKPPREEIREASNRLKTRLLNELTDAFLEFHQATGLHVKDLRVKLMPAGDLSGSAVTIVSDVDIEVGIS